jgi:hypothetical protein
MKIRLLLLISVVVFIGACVPVIKETRPQSQKNLEYCNPTSAVLCPPADDDNYQYLPHCPIEGGQWSFHKVQNDEYEWLTIAKLPEPQTYVIRRVGNYEIDQFSGHDKYYPPNVQVYADGLLTEPCAWKGNGLLPQGTVVVTGKHIKFKLIKPQGVNNWRVGGSYHLFAAESESLTPVNGNPRLSWRLTGGTDMQMGNCSEDVSRTDTEDETCFKPHYTTTLYKSDKPALIRVKRFVSGNDAHIPTNSEGPPVYIYVDNACLTGEGHHSNERIRLRENHSIDVYGCKVSLTVRKLCGPYDPLPKKFCAWGQYFFLQHDIQFIKIK